VGSLGAATRGPGSGAGWRQVRLSSALVAAGRARLP